MTHRIGSVLCLLAMMTLGGCSDAGGGEAARRTEETTTLVPTDTTATSAPSTTAAVVADEPAPTRCSASELPLEQRAALLVFAEIDNSPAQLLSALEMDLGGVFITEQAVPLVVDGTLAAAVAAPDTAPLVAIDEEGGRVQRLRDALGALPSAREMSAMGPDRVREMAAAHGQKLADLGLDVDFAPVLDIVEDAELLAGGGIGDRSFSADPTVATETARAFARGLQDASILPTYKHFPGHGHASGDSHEGLPTTPTLEEMRDDDLVPWAELLAPGEVPAAVMVGHLSVPGLTGGEPASVSRTVITDLLRNVMGFDGLVVTDDLAGMDGIRDRYSVAQAAVLAVAAGADMVLVPQSDAAGIIAVLSAAVESGSIDVDQLDESANRVLLARGCP